MLLTTLLNHVEKHKSFVYQKAGWSEDEKSLEIQVRARSNSKPVCSGCGCRAASYEQSRKARRFRYVPLWNIPVFFVYHMRRVDCPRCGVKVEQVPWSTDGKSPRTKSFSWFLAGWAKRLSWKETADAFDTSWQSVFRSVRHAVFWGLVHVDFSGVEAIGIDEIARRKGHRYMTLIYQIDEGRKRLLYVARERTKDALASFFGVFGRERSRRLKFVVSDMWQPYLDMVKEHAGQAVHVLDRFHVMKKMNEAIDQVRREEAKQMKADGYEPLLHHSRWCLLKREENLTEKQAAKLSELSQYNLKSLRARLQREDFQRFWQYRSPYWAGRFLHDWCVRAMRSRLEPMKKVVGTLRQHGDLLLNWFRAKGRFSAGVVEGLNNKAKVTMRKSYGFRSPETLEIALYHNLANLPEPKFTHTFW